MNGIVAAAYVVLAAQGAPAPQNDIASKVVSRIGPVTTWGAPAETRKDSKVKGGQAIRLTIAGGARDPRQVGAYLPIEKPVKAGDRLIFAFLARLEKGPDGAETVTLPDNGIQLDTPPNDRLFSEPVTIGREWKMYQVAGRVENDQPAGTIAATLQLATGDQVIDLGPMYVVNMGQ